MLAMICAFLVSLVMLLLLLKTGLYGIALDQPNHRSLHKHSIPRTGGIAVMAGVLAAWLLVQTSWLLFIPTSILLTVSVIDDIRGLSVRWRLLSQLIVSAGVSMAVLPEYAWWVHVLVVLGITWMMNLYNFMDGSNGLAGGMALFGFGAYAVAAAVSHDLQMAALSASIAAASFAFLLFNFHPARIFMGDGGSVPLGFLAGAIGLLGWQRELWPAWFPVLVFSPFIVDASVTLFKRLLRREKVWQAHRSHYYQRLIQMGWSHRKTAIAEYFLMMAAGTTAIYVARQPISTALLVFVAWLIIYFTIMRIIDRAWTRKSCDAEFR